MIHASVLCLAVPGPQTSINATNLWLSILLLNAGGRITWPKGDKVTWIVFTTTTTALNCITMHSGNQSDDC